MLYAISKENKKVSATHNIKAFCPQCLEPVVAKCGNINIWHWAHKKKQDCDIWHEHETAWHLQWKQKFPIENVEVVVEKEGIRHIADVLTNNNRVIEFQHSSISVEELRERECFYGNMVWVFDVIDAVKKDRLHLKNRDVNPYTTFRWKHPKKIVAFANKPVFLDYSSFRLLNLKKLYIEEPPYGGYGYYVMNYDFIKTAGMI
jgi:competence protein CoiA